MQTQGILQSMASVQLKSNANAPEKSSKTDRAAFDSFMSKDAAARTRNSDRSVGRKAGSGTGKNALDVGASKEDAGQNKVSAADGGNTPEPVEVDEVRTVEKMVVQLLQDTFGMTEEDVIDVLEQLGLVPLDLALMMIPGLNTAEFQPVNVENIKAVIMEMHGVDQEDLFLISDRMSGEFSDIIDGIENILSEQLGIGTDGLSKEDVLFLQRFAQAAEQMTESTEYAVQDTEQAMLTDVNTNADAEVPETAGQEITVQTEAHNAESMVRDTAGDAQVAANDVFDRTDNVVRQSVNTVNPDAVQNDGEAKAAGESDPDVVSSAGMKQDIPVVVEVSEESGTSNQTFRDEKQNLSEHVSRETAGRPVENPLNAFVERLTESFETVRQEGVLTSRQVTMDQIVEQVVNHVRIRVLPQTTSMELQLNPASLGRVNLNVTSQNGTATATLTVQNQVAKEALESQITVLRENLESQGLKVDAVEVNVSEFGFKHPEDSNNNHFKQKKSSQNRRIRFDAARGAGDLEDSQEAEIITSADRRDENSVVDYTA